MIENKQREVVLIADSFGFLKNFAISDTRLRPPFFPIREIARPVRHARRGPLAPDQRDFLIGTAKLSEFPLTACKTNHLTFSNRDKFSSLPLCAASPANPLASIIQPLASRTSNCQIAELESPVTLTKQTVGASLIATNRAAFSKSSPSRTHRMDASCTLIPSWRFHCNSPDHACSGSMCYDAWLSVAAK